MNVKTRIISMLLCLCLTFALIAGMPSHVSAAGGTVVPIYTNYDMQSFAGDWSKGCYVSSFAMGLQALGISSATQQAIWKLNGNKTYMSSYAYATLQKEYNFKMTETSLSGTGTERKAKVESVLKSLPAGKQLALLYITAYPYSKTITHMVVAYIDGNGAIKINDPGISNSSNPTTIEKTFMMRGWSSDTERWAHVNTYRLLTTTNIPVSKITLNHTSKTIHPDETFELIATISPDNATNKDVKWLTSDASVAVRHSSDSIVYTRGIGTTVFTATAADGSGAKATCTVTVEPHNYGSWTKVDANNHKRTCSGCGAAETQAHTWDSGKETKAPTCAATGIKTYTCTVCNATKTETIAKKNHTAGTPQLEKTNMVTRCTVCNSVITSTTVIVKDMSLEDYLSYYPSEPCSGYITPVSSEYGSIYRLPSAFNVNSVPTGDRNGKLTTTKKVIGKNVNPWGNLWYQIDDGFVYYGDVIFTDAVIELNRTSKSICVGQTFNLIATLKPESAENKDVTWSSSNDNIVAVITDHGTIKGITTGTAVVTATSTVDPNVSAACTVTVKEHNYTYQVIKEPTLSASGTLQGICSLCSGTTTVTLPKLDNTNYTAVIIKEPTITDEGTAQYTLNDKAYGSIVISIALPRMTVLTLPSSLTMIEEEAFVGVNADLIIVPAKVTAIGSRAFADCKDLSVLQFEGSPTTIAQDMLAGCSNVTIRCAKGSYIAYWATTMGYNVEYL